MIDRQFAGVLLAVATAFGPGVAAAYCWGTDMTMPGARPDFYSIRQEFRRAEYVGVVEVEGERWLDEDGKPAPLRPPFQDGASRPWGFDPYAGAFYDVKLVSRFKGRPPPRFSLFSENTTARYPMRPGERYLVFVTSGDREVVGKTLSLDSCGNSNRLEDATDTLTQVRRLANPRRRKASRPALGRHAASRSSE